MRYKIMLILLLCGSFVSGQNQLKGVLFLGNSYTYENNLPQMIADVAGSLGDTLIFDINAPGGYTLQGHSSNTASLDKIAAGSWDYVVLQEQSQLPSFPDNQVDVDVFPYAHILDSIISAANPCGETVFYMTWGRKNGDASNCAIWPPVCTYEGMDSLLNIRYRIMADSNNAILSPVGAVWNYIRKNFPVTDLYQADESHPSVAGSYAAACCFYTVLFRKDPSLISFNSTLAPADAQNIRDAVKITVYDSLMNWHIGEYDPSANYTYAVSAPNELSFTNTSENASSYRWDFGDGDTAADINPVHAYDSSGNYSVMLIASACGGEDTIIKTLSIIPSGIVNSLENQYEHLRVYPDHFGSVLILNKNIPVHFSYKIFSLVGTEVQAGSINEPIQQISISSLPAGMYLIQLFEKNNPLAQQKFVKTLE